MTRQLALILALLAGPLAAEERELDIYGFMDLEFEYDSAKDISTFDIHHFNIINTYSFERFRVFSEMEWEHGPQIEAAKTEGEITLERGWFEYIYSDRLKVRGGKFLTPFGIYNLIHDSTPVFLTTSLPLIYGKHNPFGTSKGRLYAKFYTGLQILGSHATGDDVRLSYWLGLGNGRGQEQFSADNDQNKSLILRLRLALPQELSLGLSHYRDRNEQGLSGLPRARERATGLDLEFTRDALLLQAEYARYSLERAGGFRDASAYYGLIAYQLAGFATPIVRYDRFDPDADAADDANDQWLVGVNLALDPRIYLKGEWLFKSAARGGDDWVHLSSISIAF